MNLVILDAKTLGNDIDLTIFKQFGNITTYNNTSAHQTAKRVQNADIIMTNKVHITKDIMQNSKCKLICELATGTDNIDLIGAKELGIDVKNVAGYSTQSVIQVTFSMLFHLLANTPYYDEFVKSKKWVNSGLFTCMDMPFEEISGKTWGIIGLGNIGKQVAHIASAFGCEIQYYSTSGANNNQMYKQVDLDTLMSSSDIISIHAPMNSKTNNLITTNELTQMKDKAIILNLGRGGIINEDDLALAMNNTNIKAGLDVTKQEPLPIDSPLYNIKNPQRLLITPHIAWASVQARKTLINMTVDNIKEYLKEN